MLSKTDNELITQVGKGTPGGELLRRYWHPIAGLSELDGEPVLPVRLLGEDLVLYRDLGETLGLIGAECSHRKVSMAYGIPEIHGLRCCYHGWLYDEEGNCLEQPAESTASRFKERICHPAYPVEVLGGLVWAYLGPKPVPLLPRFDVFAWDNAWRDIGKAVIPCNWFQVMENSADQSHVDYLHGHYYDYVLRRAGKPERESSERVFDGRKQAETTYDLSQFGIRKRSRLVGIEGDAAWTELSPFIFPNMSMAPTLSAQIRVPIDDTHTMHIMYSCYRPDDGDPVPPQSSIPVYDVPMYDDRGRFTTDWITGQDMMAMSMQGPIMDRTTEQLGVSDSGVVFFRKTFLEQIENVQRGEDPLGVLRSPADNSLIVLSNRNRGPFNRVHYMDNHWHKFSPIYEEAKALMLRHVLRDQQAEVSHPSVVG